MKERGKKNNNILVILILIILSNNLMSFEQNESTIKNKIRKDLTSSLLVNLLYDHVINGDYHGFRYHIKYILLDYNSQFLLNTHFGKDTIEYNGESYTIIKYQFKYVNSSDQESWNDSTIGPGSSRKQIKSSVEYSNFPISEYGKFKLFENGLYFHSIKTNNLVKMSMENDCYTALDSLTIENVSSEINYRFYNYLPDNIEVQIQNSSFSFFSKVLNRFILGRINYNQLSYRYQLELVNGVLK